MTLAIFIRILLALVLGACIGLERQWRQRTTGLRTNALVAIGAAMFVIVSGLTPNDGSPTRIASYVVSGIGFLGAGVIMKAGPTVTGLNTAATLWCTGAVGVLCGMGHLMVACTGAGFVLVANVVLRPIGHRINRATVGADEEQPKQFLLKAVCASEAEGRVRSQILHGLQAVGLTLRALHSEDLPRLDRLEVFAEVEGLGGVERRLEEIVARLSLDPSVSAVRWETRSFDEAGFVPETGVVLPASQG